ncbi:MAG TPA: tetratricopeptide repeat protein [Chloroflexota bacterium]|nr:tetratricopeptide repeat protein [Chloroflexota bacterium]
MTTVEVPADRPVSYSRQFRRCGKQACLVCGPGMPGHGPYWYAYWHEDGRTRSRYLGRVAPPGVLERPETPGAGNAAPVEPRSPPPQGPGLRVRTLGGFAVWLGDAAVPAGHWRRPTVAALFKILLSAPGHRLTRDQALEALWPEADPEQGPARLRGTIHRLRQVVGTDRLAYQGEMLALLPGSDDAYWLDADAFEARARLALAGRDPAACRVALALYGGDYLPDDVYAEWAVGRREELQGLRLSVLLHAATLCEQAGASEEAERYLRTVLATDSCHEGAALDLMRLCVAAGRPAQAMRIYRRLAAALREDLNLAPAAQTRALYQALVTQQRATPPQAAPAEPAVPTNLPEPLSSFIGRRRELAAVRALLRPRAEAYSPAAEAVPCRLVTLTGVGGCGKTRLALRVADELLEDYPDGVWLVDLSPLGEARLVGQAVARALGLGEDPARPVLDLLKTALRHRNMLLVLDNCEHLIGTCAELAVVLLEHCPALRILATSREALRVPGERLWPVPPLSVPEAGADLPAGRLLEAESARLFMDRARVQRPDLALGDETAAAVADICRRLDGLPLAIELAAARTRLLSVEQIAARLGQRLALLTGGPRTAAARQRTLRAALDWSYDLLSPEEQMLFRRLAVFAGGCTLEAAEAVCRSDGDLHGDVLECLSSLMDKSLLRHQPAPSTEQSAANGAPSAPRFGLLETVREYGLAQLAADGETPMLQRRHAAYFLSAAEEAAQLLRGPEQRVWLARLADEHDNLRAALRWALESGEALLGLKMAGVLWQFWEIGGHVREGREWLERLLAHESPVADVAFATARAAALNGAGALAFDQGDFPRATALHEECLALRRAIDDRRGMAVSLNNLGNSASSQGDYSRALTCYGESLALKRQLGDTRGMSVTLSNMGVAAYEQGDYERAHLLYEEALALKWQLGDSFGIAIALNNLGELARERGDTLSAVPLFEKALGLHRELRNTRGIAIALSNLGHVAREHGDAGRALALYAESLTLAYKGGDQWEVAFCLEGLAAAAYEQGQLQRAVRLWGSAAALRAAIDAPRAPIDQASYDRGVADARAALGDGEFAAAWAAGQAMSMEAAVALALEQGGP